MHALDHGCGAVRRMDTGQDRDQCGLPRSVATDECVDAARLDLEINVVQRAGLAERV
jgi:hypothetical protein